MTNEKTYIPIASFVCFTLIQNKNKGISVNYIEGFMAAANQKLQSSNLNYLVDATTEDINTMIDCSPVLDTFNGKIKFLTEMTTRPEMKRITGIVENSIPEKVRNVLDSAKKHYDEELKERENN